MFGNVILKTLYDMRKSLLGWLVGLFLLNFIVVLFYPTIQENSEAISDLISSLPEEVKVFTGETEDLDYTTLRGFLQTEMFSFFLPVLTLGFAINYGSNFIASEEESGTLEILLSTQVSRWRVVLEKFVALILFTVLALLAIFAGLMMGAIVAGLSDADPGLLLAGVANLFPITMFYGALALCVTGLRSGRGLALGISIGLVAVSYLTTMLSMLSDVPEWIARLSPWRYYDSVSTLSAGLQPWNMILLLIVSAGWLLLGAFAFTRRDIHA